MKRNFFSLLTLFLCIIGCIRYNTFAVSKGSKIASSINSISSTPQATSSTSSLTPPVGKQPLAATNWTMYHNDLARTGYLPSMPDPQKLAPAWMQSLDGAVYAEPLVVDGHVIVATENDTIYSLDATTGKIQWQKNVGTPVPQRGLPCGNIFPLGITGTPVYDPATKLVFAVAEVLGPRHTLVGLDIQTGAIKLQRSADLPSMDARAHQQRAALALWKNIVYFAYGGLNGDCSDYIGRVIGSQTNGQGPLLSYQVPTKREAGIWATPGPVIDANGNLYIAVGNGDATNGKWDHSDSVLRLSPTLQLEDGFAPTNWGRQNAADQDLGSMGPVLLSDNQIFTDGKAGKGYLLDATNLGGVGGQLLEQNVCNAFGGSATTGSVIFVPCTDGLLQLTIRSGTINRGWRAPAGINGSPIIGGNTVYTIGIGTLYALDRQTGKIRAQATVGENPHFATPTLSGRFVFVGTISGISALTIL